MWLLLWCPQAFLEREQIESFISAGQVLLQLQANSVEEIGRAGAEAKALVDRLGEVGQVRLTGRLCQG